jgi:hypothetical protein
MGGDKGRQLLFSLLICGPTVAGAQGPPHAPAERLGGIDDGELLQLEGWIVDPHASLRRSTEVEDEQFGVLPPPEHGPCVVRYYESWRESEVFDPLRPGRLRVQATYDRDGRLVDLLRWDIFGEFSYHRQVEWGGEEPVIISIGREGPEGPLRRWATVLRGSDGSSVLTVDWGPGEPRWTLGVDGTGRGLLLTIEDAERITEFVPRWDGQGRLLALDRLAGAAAPEEVLAVRRWGDGVEEFWNRSVDPERCIAWREVDGKWGPSVRSVYFAREGRWMRTEEWQPQLGGGRLRIDSKFDPVNGLDRHALDENCAPVWQLFQQSSGNWSLLSRVELSARGPSSTLEVVRRSSREHCVVGDGVWDHLVEWHHPQGEEGEPIANLRLWRVVEHAPSPDGEL